MSQENLDLLRSLYAAWGRGDYSAVEWADPEMEFVIADGPAPGRWTGPRGLKEGMSEFLNAWDDLRPEVDEYREVDDERVIVLDHPTGRGKTSGLDLRRINIRGAQLFHVRDGKVTRIVHYFDRGRALADLGLKE